jgi:glycosyltransferase involved in cell wall biosynthesis
MISVTILTKNSEKYLEKVLSSLASFDEVVIFDTGSTDGTEAIARQFPNVSWHTGLFTGFGPTHNQASSLAKHDWILSLDSDEVMTEELAVEIFSLKLDDKTTYSFWRKNFYRGKHIRGCGWYPDRVTRLYNRKATQFSEAKVHEKILTRGLKCISLKSPVLHYPFDSVSSFLKKVDVYSGLFESTKKSSITKAFFHALFAFIRSYIFQRGFLLGGEGLEISWYNMNSAFYKYAKLAEKQAITQV